MMKPEFQYGVQRIVRAFNHLPIKIEVVDEWFSRVNKIPRREWDFIVDRIIQEEEVFPRNFCKTVNKFYYEARAHFSTGVRDENQEFTHEEVKKNLDAYHKMLRIYYSGDPEERAKLLGLTAAMLYSTDGHKAYDPYPASSQEIMTRKEVLREAAKEVERLDSGGEGHGLIKYLYGGE